MDKKTATSGLVAIDLFSGAGGFSLGMEQAGFRVAAAIDADPHAVGVYRQNFSHEIIEGDIRQLSPEKFKERTGIKNVDVIFGGPPCQGFSFALPSNHGAIFESDDRRLLYKEFLQYVRFFKPKMFIMENVSGIRRAAGGAIFQNIQQEIGNIGYSFHCEKTCAWRFGVPQKRIRYIIVGVREDLPPIQEETWVMPTHADLDNEVCTTKLKKLVTLWEAIGDLPPLKAGESTEKYDLARRMKMIGKHSEYLRGVVRVEKASELTGHSARGHSARDLRDFAKLKEGWTSAYALRRGIKMEFPYTREKFKDRYTRQHRNKLCSTIMAHLSKDGLMFIHPTQQRSFTPREAARVQSFPDTFVFPFPRTHQFRLIGNAVPPLMGLAIGNAVKKHLRQTEKQNKGKGVLFSCEKGRVEAPTVAESVEKREEELVNS